VLFDQPGGPRRVARREGMMHGVVDQPMRCAPRGRLPMQIRHTIGLGLLQPQAQNLGKQLVIAIPAALFIERDKEEIRALQLLQHGLAIGSPCDRIAQPDV
jgi:hypothetical protein